MKKEDRLELIAPELSLALERASERCRRRAARVACEYALARVSLTAPALDTGLLALRAGKFGQREVLASLEQLTEALDAEYFDLQEKADAGEVEQEAFLAAFKKARAANAVCFALKPDSLEASRESIYEANAATEDLEGLREAVLAALKTES
jgi:hypothetical protein